LLRLLSPNIHTHFWLRSWVFANPATPQQPHLILDPLSSRWSSLHADLHSKRLLQRSVARWNLPRSQGIDEIMIISQTTRSCLQTRREARPLGWQAYLAAAGKRNCIEITNH
jgi:hypothetical protein